MVELTGMDYLIAAGKQIGSSEIVQNRFMVTALAEREEVREAFGEQPLINPNQDPLEQLAPYEETAVRILRTSILIALEQGDEESIQGTVAVACRLATHWRSYLRAVAPDALKGSAK